MMSIKREANESMLLMNDIHYDLNHNTYKDIDKIMAVGGDNFKGVCDALSLTGEKAYCVCGSSDQSLELIFRDFKKVDVFDINLLSRHMLNLKLAAIMALNYEEFIIFSKELFENEKILQKIYVYLDLETKKYFDLLFKMTKPKNVCNNLITHKYIEDYCKENFSFYNEKEYYILKEKLLKASINFYHHNIFDRHKLHDSYDFIYFSNILLFNSKNINNFKRTLLPYYIKHLNDNGIFVLHYMHYYSNTIGNKNLHDKFTQEANLQIEANLLDVFNLKVNISASGFGHGIGTNDAILVLKKD